jgi:hypothetical protein
MTDSPTTLSSASTRSSSTKFFPTTPRSDASSQGSRLSKEGSISCAVPAKGGFAGRMRDAVSSVFRGWLFEPVPAINQAIKMHNWTELDALLKADTGMLASNDETLLLAVEYGISSELFNKLIARVDKKIVLNTEYRNILHVAVLKDQLGILTSILENFPLKKEEIDYDDQQNKTALCYAAEKLNMDMVNSLVNAGADLIDAKNKTIFHWLAKNSQKDAESYQRCLKTVRCFIRGTANVLIYSQNEKGETELRINRSSNNTNVTLVTLPKGASRDVSDIAIALIEQINLENSFVTITNPTK